MEFKKLETFRENNFGQIAFLLQTVPQIILPINYDILAIHAYRFTTNSLRELEASDERLNSGLQNLPAVNMWYQSVHSFLNAVLQITILKVGGDFNQLSEFTLDAKYQHLLNVLAIPVADREQQLFEKLADFTRFELGSTRNFIDSSQVSYQRANFSPHPIMLNQVDVMQSMIISLEVFQSFRLILAGLDLMPNISLMVSSHMVFDKLDLLYRSVIVPAFTDILSKQNLSSDLILDIDTTSYPASILFNKGQILIIEKVVEDERFNRKEDIVKTDIMGDLFNQFTKRFSGKLDRTHRNYLAPGFQFLKKGEP